MNAHSVPGRPQEARDPDQILIPKPILYMIIALVVFSIVSIALGREYQVGVTHEGVLHPVETTRFTVTGSEGGALVATRADGSTITLAKSGEEIFPRLILRSLSNMRDRDGVALSRPLQLDVLPSGQRLLIDPYTGIKVRMAAFGPQNGHVFDVLLPSRGAK